MWMPSSERSTPSVGRTSSTGTSASVPGQVVGSRPPGSTAPLSTSARASPYCSPPNQVSTIAATSCRQGISTGDPEFTTTTVRGLAAATACTSASWWPGRASDDRSKPSDSTWALVPTTTIATSAAAATRTASSISTSAASSTGREPTVRAASPGGREMSSASRLTTRSRYTCPAVSSTRVVRCGGKSSAAPRSRVSVARRTSSSTSSSSSRMQWPTDCRPSSTGPERSGRRSATSSRRAASRGALPSHTSSAPPRCSSSRTAPSAAKKRARMPDSPDSGSVIVDGSSGKIPLCTTAPSACVMVASGQAARRPSSGATVDSGTTVALPPPCVRATSALWPTTATDVGQSALVARTQGGGSATVVPESTVAPLDGLRAAWPDATITHALGAVVHSGIFPLEPSTITDPESGESGMRARFFAADGAVLLDEHRGGAELVWLGNAPREAARLELVADLRPERSGPVELGLQSVGHCILELDDEVLLDVRLATDTLDLGAALLFPPHRPTRVELTAGQVYRLRVVSRLAEDISRPPGLAALTVGSRPVDEAAEVLIDEAVRVAAAADVAIVVVGTNAQVESEGFDRSSLALPGHQDALVHAVAAANPRTVVVVNSGSPVLMPWRHEVAAIVLTWFGGEQYGHALADVLSGAVEPGGRLPTTWPGTEADVPVLDVRPTDGVLRYDEGIHIGYRAWQRIGRAPAYPFGFGLGYTTWRYDAVAVDAAGDGDVVVRVDLANTGDRSGRRCWPGRRAR